MTEKYTPLEIECDKTTLKMNRNINLTLKQLLSNVN